MHMCICMYVCMLQIVSCSGFGKDGSLRIVRSGIGLNEQASIDLRLVKGQTLLHSII